MVLHTDFLLTPAGWWFSLATIVVSSLGASWLLYQESKRND